MMEWVSLVALLLLALALALRGAASLTMEGFVQHAQPWLPDCCVRAVVWLYLGTFLRRLNRLDLGW